MPPAIERATRRALGCGAFTVLTLIAVSSAGQEEDTADHGSRAAHKSSRPAHRAKRKTEPTLSTNYHIGVFGGSFIEDSRPAVMLNAGLAAVVIESSERVRASAEYQYDPFTTKTFNFSEEEAASGASRLTQGLHEIDLSGTWQSRWSRWIRSELALSGDVWVPENDQDRRWSLRSAIELDIGRPRGVYVEPLTALVLKKYPDYLVSDRRIDQWGSESALEAGYRWAPYNSAALGFKLDVTNYLDSRYDVLTPDGAVLRSDESKRYLSTIPYATLAFTPAKPLRLSVTYEYEFNDSSHYNRRIAGQSAVGSSELKYIPDYYDFNRQRATLKAKFSPAPGLSMSGLAEGWLRAFETYEARDPDNVWTGDLRQDTSLEIGAEVSYRLFEIGTGILQNGLFATCFGSHLERRSNMQREVSLATNFDVSRVFVGVELRPE